MPRYTVQAADAAGRITIAQFDAPNRDEISSLLMTRGQFAVAISEARDRKWWSPQLSRCEAALGLRVLSSLLSAGLPVMKALHAMQTVAPAAWARALPTVRAMVKEGAPLSEALTGAGIRLPAAAIGMINAGESGSDAAGAISRASRLLEAQEQSRSALISALTYPALLATAGLVSIAVMVGLVLPRFERILTDMGAPLPAAMSSILSAGVVLRSAALPFGALLIGGSLAWRSWASTPDGRWQWHEVLLRLPLIGPLRLCAASARTTDAMAALLSTGVSVSTALEQASPAAGDAAVERRLAIARDLILEGRPLTAAFDTAQAVTPTVVFFVAAAEQTGNLGEMLEHAANIESERATRMVRTATGLAEPLLILVLAALIAVVAGALLQALYGIQPGI